MSRPEQYLRVNKAYNPTFDPQGGLAFLADYTGTTQIWTLSDPNDTPTKLTEIDREVQTISYSPHRREIVSQVRKPKSTDSDLYLTDSSNTITNLTSETGGNHYLGGWGPDGDRIVYTANRSSNESYNVYIQARREPGSEATCIYTGEGLTAVAGFSFDGVHILVRDINSKKDQDLYVINIETGNQTLLTDHGEKSTKYKYPSWGPDGEYVYCATDQNSDFLELYRIKISDKSHEKLQPTDWNIDGISVDPRNRTLIYSQNVGGYTSLTPLKIQSGHSTGSDGEFRKLISPSLPDGVIGGVEYSKTGHVAVTVTGPKCATNIYTFDVHTGKSMRWTDIPTGKLDRSDFKLPKEVGYEGAYGREIPAFVSFPNHMNEQQNSVPAVVDIHGGPQSQRRPTFNPIPQFLVNHGYVVFEPNIRGSSGYGKEYAALDDVTKRADALTDIRCGIQYLQSYYAIDPNRIAVMGNSYGGYMTFWAMSEFPDIINTGVSIAGFYDLISYLSNLKPKKRERRQKEYGSLQEDREFLHQISPINKAKRIDSPLLIMHGEMDSHVPIEQAHKIISKLENQGVPVQKVFFPEEGHKITRQQNREEIMKKVHKFFAEYN